jgi:putative sugar O-methyltransferase
VTEQETLQNYKDQTKCHESYEKYKYVLTQVNDVLKSVRRNSKLVQPSEYWLEELAGFDYMFEAGPLLIEKLRQHTFHITGVRHYDYRSSQVASKRHFEDKLNQLSKIDSKKHFLPESKKLGGFGHLTKDGLVNIDTLKFYESILALYKHGILEKLEKLNSPRILEIGSGWGGFAYQMKHFLPKSCYILVDFPELFLFSATYLLSLFPQSKAYFVKSLVSSEEMNHLMNSHDFVFIPQELFSEMDPFKINLACNMVSFQEMTSDQVIGYAKRAAECNAEWIYSHNREKSKHNNEISSVSECLSRHFNLEKVTVLENSQYTDVITKKTEKPTLKSKHPLPWVPTWARPIQSYFNSKQGNLLKNKLRKLLLNSSELNLLESVKPETQKKKISDNPSFYRHYVGTKKLGKS